MVLDLVVGGVYCGVLLRRPARTSTTASTAAPAAAGPDGPPARYIDFGANCTGSDIMGRREIRLVRFWGTRVR